MDQVSRGNPSPTYRRRECPEGAPLTSVNFHNVWDIWERLQLQVLNLMLSWKLVVFVSGDAEVFSASNPTRVGNLQPLSNGGWLFFFPAQIHAAEERSGPA